jgi:hypothetical protein
MPMVHDTEPRLDGHIFSSLYRMAARKADRWHLRMTRHGGMASGSNENRI